MKVHHEPQLRVALLHHPLKVLRHLLILIAQLHLDHLPHRLTPILLGHLINPAHFLPHTAPLKLAAAIIEISHLLLHHHLFLLHDLVFILDILILCL
jgi:hypothetical protein